MKRVKKLVVLGIGILMSTSLLTACSADEFVVFNAAMKSQKIKSMESKTDIAIKVSAENLSPQEQQMMLSVLPIINSSKVSVLSKINGNGDNTAAKMESKINLENESMQPLEMGIWVDTNLVADKPVIKEVVKVPEMFAAQFPEQFKNKQYMVMDLGAMNNVPEVPQIDYNKLAEFSKEFQPKIMDFITNYAKQYDHKLDIIKRVGTEDIVQPTMTQRATIYELKLSDKTFKDLIRYTAKNFVENKEAMKFIKEYMLFTISTIGLPEDEFKIAKEEMEKSFSVMETQLPEVLDEINKGLDEIENIKILGDKGITIRYAINNDGFIINESGYAEFVIDLETLYKTINDANSSVKPSDSLAGKYTIGIDFKNDIRNINGNVSVTFPEVNKTNSFTYEELMNLVTNVEEGQVDEVTLNEAKKLVQEAKSSLVFADYNEAYGAVLALPAEEQYKLLAELSTISKDVYTSDIIKVLTSMETFSKEKDINNYYQLKSLIDSEVKIEKNKQYLLGELVAWGDQIVFTEDVVASTEAIIKAWETKDTESIKFAEACIGKVKNSGSNKWLTEQLNQLKASIN
jgi:hypothetical protein